MKSIFMTKKINNLFLSWKQTREKSVGKQHFMNHRLWQYELVFHTDAMTPVPYTVWFSSLCMCALFCPMHWKKCSSVSAHCTLSISVLFDVAAMRKFSIVGSFPEWIVGNEHPNISVFVLTWFLLQIVSTGTCMKVLILQLWFLDLKEYLLVSLGYFITFIQKPWGPVETCCCCCCDLFFCLIKIIFSPVFMTWHLVGEKRFPIFFFFSICGNRWKNIRISEDFCFSTIVFVWPPEKINRLCCTNGLFFQLRNNHIFFFWNILFLLLLFFINA